MKKFLATIISLVMALSLVACGGQKEPTEFKTIKDLFDAGYTCSTYQYCEGKWAGLFRKDESLDKLFMVTASMTDADQDALDAIDWEDEEGDAKRLAVYEGFKDVVITNIADQIPSQDELNKYVGKTVGDLKADGYEPTGYVEFDEPSYFFDGKFACISVNLETKAADPDNIPDEAVIKSVEFMDLGNGILDDQF